MALNSGLVEQLLQVFIEALNHFTFGLKAITNNIIYIIQLNTK